MASPVLDDWDVDEEVFDQHLSETRHIQEERERQQEEAKRKIEQDKIEQQQRAELEEQKRIQFEQERLKKIEENAAKQRAQSRSPLDDAVDMIIEDAHKFINHSDEHHPPMPGEERELMMVMSRKTAHAIVKLFETDPIGLRKQLKKQFAKKKNADTELVIYDRASRF